jgi:hypothetical protein
MKRREHVRKLEQLGCGDIQSDLAGLRGNVMTKKASDSERAATELIFIVEDAPEGGYTARALGESIFTETDDLASLHEQVRDAVRCHFEEGHQPKIIRLHFVREEVIAV